MGGFSFRVFEEVQIFIEILLKYFFLLTKLFDRKKQ